LRRSRTRISSTHEATGKAAPVASPSLSPESEAIRAELGGAILRALEGLPERLRTIVLMRDVEQLTSEEACNILGVSETNQRVLLHRARVQLRAALEPHLARRQEHPSC
jgi:RNA polymerase sigma-70 factor (ECF subfamily)